MNYQLGTPDRKEATPINIHFYGNVPRLLSALGAEDFDLSVMTCHRINKTGLVETCRFLGAGKVEVYVCDLLHNRPERNGAKRALDLRVKCLTDRGFSQEGAVHVNGDRAIKLVGHISDYKGYKQ